KWIGKIDLTLARHIDRERANIAVGLDAYGILDTGAQHEQRLVGRAGAELARHHVVGHAVHGRITTVHAFEVDHRLVVGRVGLVALVLKQGAFFHYQRYRADALYRTYAA